MDEFIHYLQRETVKPTNFHGFHLIYVFLTITIIIILCIKYRNISVKSFKIFIFIVWMLMLIMEIYKQIILSFNYGGDPKWVYRWYNFPFQLCSTPLYIYPLIVFINPKKNKFLFEALLSYASFVVGFAGMTVLVNAETVFCTSLGINIQSMTHHAIQVIVGVFSIAWYHKNLNIKYYLKGLIIFIIMVSIAVSLDIIVPKYISGSFNMFYISPKEEFIVPWFNISSYSFPYPVYLFGYIFLVALAGLLILGISILFNNIANKKEEKLKIA